MDEQKLTPKEYLELAIEAGIGAIPVIGGPVQTIYFGRQNEKKFKRIEAFYHSLQKDLDSMKNKIPNIQDVSANKDQLMGIFETINDEVEKARSQSKIEFYKNLYKNCLLNINNTYWDEEEYFLEVLSKITSTQIEIISYLIPKQEFTAGIFSPKLSQSIIDGSLNTLVDMGILRFSH